MPTQTDCQRIVEEIQHAISSEGVVSEATLAELTADYQVACEDANQRLRECGELLRKGLRGEAIQRCEVEPNLLDFVAALDFAERSQWCDWLLLSGRALPPPPLLMEVAAELNAAYAQEQPLAAPMRLHRLLALARAPLGDRISVLRQIAEADAGNAIWDDDLRSYETQRHKQLQAEAESAARAGDAQTLSRIEQELSASLWRSPPPPALVQRVAQFATRLRGEQARAEMRHLEPQLTAAFSDFDVERARLLRGRWQACALLADLPGDDPLVELIAPALEWLAEQDRRDQSRAAYEQAASELGQALDADRGRQELERIHHRLVQCELGMPEVLDRRFRERMASLALADSRRNKLLFAALSAAVLATAGLTLFWISHQLGETEAADAAASLHALLEEHKLPEAQKYLETLGVEKPRLRQRAEIQELHARLQGLAKDETERRAAFRAALAGVREAGFDRPDRKMLDEARRLAKSPGEETDVLKLDQQIASRQRELQDQRNKAFVKRVEKLSKRLEELDLSSSNDPERRLAEIRELQRESADLASHPDGAESMLIRNAKALHARLATMYETQQLEIEQSRQLQAINAAIGDRTRFRHALGEYVKRFPGGKRAGDFQKVLDADGSAAEQLEKWNVLNAMFAKLDPHSTSSSDAAARIVEAKPLLDGFHDVPQAELIRQRVALFEPIAKRGTGAARIDSSLKEMFKFPTLAGLTMVKTKDGKRYYSDQQPKTSGNVITIHYLSDFKLSKRTKTVGLDDLAEPGVVEAPQSALGRAVLDELARMDDPHWETTFCRLASQVREDGELGPILKLQLLTQLLTVARTGSLVLDRAYAKPFELLSNSGLDGAVNWLDPEDKKAQTASKTAEDLLQRLPDLRASRDAAAEEYARLRKPWVALQYRWVGWLRLEENGRWNCSSNLLPEDWSGDLLLIGLEGRPPKAKFTKLGRLTQGRVEMTIEDPAMVEGQPIYLAIADDATQ